ncbi:MAG: hypothetical protein ACOYOA_08400 [Saprospiraceae bacterium]
MKKIFLFFVSSLCFELLIAQNELSSEHINLKGTRFAMIPPTADFIGKTSPVLGFEDSKHNAMISIVELDLSKGEQNSIQKAQKALMENGKSFIGSDEWLVSGIPAKLRKVRGLQRTSAGEGVGQMAEFIISELSFSYEQFNIYIFSSYPAKYDDEIGKKVEESLKSLVYLKNKRIDPLDKLNFTIDVRESRLKPNLVMPTLLQLNLSGADTGDDQPFFTITQFAATPENVSAIGDGNSIMNGDLSSPLISDKHLHLFENVQFKGTEVTAYENEVNGRIRLLYTAVLRGDKYIYRIRGESLFDYEGYIQEFRKLTESVRE